jgi:antitoxin Phd
MKVYSFSEARQRFAEVLRQAKQEGQAQIRRRDGQLFVVQPAQPAGSPLDVPGVASDLAAREIVDLVRDSRRSTERLLRQTPAPKKRLPRRARRSRG